MLKKKNESQAAWTYNRDDRSCKVQYRLEPRKVTNVDASSEAGRKERARGKISGEAMGYAQRRA